jgi:hypothetical protein
VGLALRLVSSRVLGKSETDLPPVRKSNVSGTRNIRQVFFVFGFKTRVRRISNVGRSVGSIRSPAARRPTAERTRRI